MSRSAIAQKIASEHCGIVLLSLRECLEALSFSHTLIVSLRHSIHADAPRLT